jgi:(p)ppGpp synthase/HD superfamily hydrolase
MGGRESLCAARDAEVVARTAFAKNWDTLAHTIRVVEQLGSDATDEERAVAWLHDVVEDTEVEIVDLKDIGFSDDVTHAVFLLSRSYGSDYDAYKRGLLDAPGEAGRLARKVKLADARENLSRCEAAVGIPKWQGLADKRYRPLIAALEGMGDRRRG